jgi:hypothetical protein
VDVDEVATGQVVSPGIAGHDRSAGAQGEEQRRGALLAVEEQELRFDVGGSVTPSRSRGLNFTSGLPVRSVITAPIGYDSDTEASRLVMWLSSHTQPRWKSGSCNVPFAAWLSRSLNGLSRW